MEDNMMRGAIQLGQALASGRLGGDELKSILEGLPLVAEKIAKGLGVSTGELKKMGAEGLLTADKVFGALLSGTEKIQADFALRCRWSRHSTRWRRRGPAS